MLSTTRGKYVYLGVGPRLVILDVSQPAHPAVIGQSDVLPAVLQAVIATETHVYVATAAGEQGLFVVDVTDPAHPAEVGHLPGRAWDVAISDSTAYVADGQSHLHILDLADPHGPAALGSYQTDEMAVIQVLVEGDTAYISDNLGTEGTYPIFYVVRPRRPKLVITKFLATRRLI